MAISDVNFDANGQFDKEREALIVKGEKEHTKIQEKFDLGGISESERVDKLGELWNDYTKQIATLLESSLPKDNAIYKMVTSKARGNWIQIRSIMGMRGPVTKSSGEFAAMPVKGNYLIGLTANEYFVNATGARKGNADTAMKTAAAGYLTRRLVDVAQDVIIRIEDCETTRGIVKDDFRSVDENGTVEWSDNKLELSVLHRTLAEDITAGKTVIAKAGSSIDQHVIAAIKANDVESVKVRTVLTCQADAGLCAKCYGVSLATGNAVELGEAVGIIAAQSIGEPGTQLTMRTFHTGGASDKTKKEVIKTRSGGKETRAERTINYDITQGLTGVTDLLEARIGMSQKDKVAVIAFWPGKVDIREVESKSGAKRFEVRVVPQGDKALADAKEIAKSYTFSRTASKTFKKLDPELPITIVDDESLLLVIDGEEVQRGDFIKNGTPIPQEVLATKSVNEAAKEIINGVQAIYGAQDVALHDKHLEVIVRQMLSKVTIVDSGETDLMPGAQMDRRTYMRINKEARDEGKKTASARDEVLGMTRASLAAESWLSAASFQETTRVLTQAALDRSTDKLKGLKENVIIGKLIPAGTGLAAYRQIDAVPTEEAKAERYPNIPWATTSDESIDFKDDSFSGAGLSFTSLEDYSNEEPAQ
jgi:DNA-directed RNA polymerase subunit beta'